MNKRVFTIKDESAFKFFIEHTPSTFDKVDLRDRNIYYLFRPELFFYKNTFEDSTDVIFELRDVAEGSRAELVNTYTYKVETYDDVSDKLTLIDFKVEHKQNETENIQ